MDVTTTKDSINVINGIKSISCFLMLALHMLWYDFFATSNPGVMFHLSEKVRYQWIANSPLMVETFFAISGFLLTYHFLKKGKQMTETKENSFVQNVKLFGKLLMHRYIRLSPLYLMVVLMTEILTSYIVNMSKFSLNCQRYWWRNLLYINNLFEYDDFCMAWTWSLACDMQFFLVFTIILFVYVKNNALGNKIFIAITFSTSVIGYVINVEKNFVPSYDVMIQTINELYTAPWMRVAPYCVGVGFGWYLNSYRKTFAVSYRVRNFLFFISTLYLVLALHSTIIQRDLGFTWATVGLLVGRLMIAIAASWFIITNACGYDCFVSRIFSSRIFIHINKLTYAIYLLHPIIIIVAFGKFDNGGTVDTALYFFLLISISLVTYVLATVFVLLFEIPFNKLSNVILRGSKLIMKKVNLD